MSDTPEFLAGRLRDEGEKVQVYFQALTSDEWGRPIYTEGSPWVVQQVMAHFVSTEVSIIDLLLSVLSGGEGAPAGFDIDAFNTKEVATLSGIPGEELVRQFTRLRQKTVSVVGRMTVDDLARTGRHPFLGIAPLTDIVKLIYRHNQIHLRDVKRVIEG